MKFILVGLALAIITNFPLHAAPGRISVNGNKFVDPDGKIVVFKGLSTSDPIKLKRGNVWNAAYFDAAKTWGSNIVRFPVHPNAWRELGEREYIKLLDEGIALAAARDMHVIIDWHSIGNLHQEKFFRGAGGYPTTSYDTTVAETFAFWRSMARHYGKNPAVAFFELFNEPATGEAMGMGECSWDDWRALMEKLILDIRAHGGEPVPLVAGFNFAYDLKPAISAPVKLPNVAYVSHPYPGKIKDPAAWTNEWTRDWGAMAEKHPIILTEIGFQLPGEPGGYDPIIGDSSYAEAILDYCAERGISYTLWCFDNSWVPTLIADWNFAPTRSGAIFKEAMLRDRSDKTPTISINP